MNMTIQIKIDSTNKVRKFLDNISDINCNLDIQAKDGHYVIDAKSIMGIFSLDLSKPVNLLIHSEDPTIIEQVTNAVSEFITK